MPITVTEPGDGGTLVTVPEPAPDPTAALPPGEASDPGASAPPAPDAPAAPAPGEEAPPASAPDVPDRPETSEDDDEDEVPLDDAPGQAGVPRGVQRKIDREVRRRHEAERKAAAIEARLQMLEQGYQRPPQEPAPVPVHEQPAPRDIDYPSNEEWLTARDAWQEARILHRVRLEQQQQRQQQEAQQREQQMLEQATAARQKYADFDTVLDRLKGLYTAPALDACVHESELGAELAYYLAQHPEEITRLNQVAQTAPLAMAREIGKLEMRLSSPTNGTSPRPTPPTPKPAPPTPLSGAGSPGTRTLYDMSDEEINAMSQKEYDAIYQRMYPGSR